LLNTEKQVSLAESQQKNVILLIALTTGNVSTLRRQSIRRRWRV